MPTITIKNIKPLSVNQAWCGRRFKSKDYKEYEKEVFFLMNNFTITMVEGEKLIVNIIFYFKYPLKRDIDNCIKPLLDIMQKKGLYKDDRYIWELNIVKEQSDEEGFKITINKIL